MKKIDYNEIERYYKEFLESPTQKLTEEMRKEMFSSIKNVNREEGKEKNKFTYIITQTESFISASISYVDNMFDKHRYFLGFYRCSDDPIQVMKGVLHKFKIPQENQSVVIVDQQNLEKYPTTKDKSKGEVIITWYSMYQNILKQKLRINLKQLDFTDITETNLNDNVDDFFNYISLLKNVEGDLFHVSKLTNCSQFEKKAGVLRNNIRHQLLSNNITWINKALFFHPEHHHWLKINFPKAFDNIIKEYDLDKNEIDLYLHDNDPFKSWTLWWKEKRNTYPSLSNIAREFIPMEDFLLSNLYLEKYYQIHNLYHKWSVDGIGFCLLKKQFIKFKSFLNQNIPLSNELKSYCSANVPHPTPIQINLQNQSIVPNQNTIKLSSSHESYTPLSISHDLPNHLTQSIPQKQQTNISITKPTIQPMSLLQNIQQTQISPQINNNTSLQLSIQQPFLNEKEKGITVFKKHSLNIDPETSLTELLPNNEIEIDLSLSEEDINPKLPKTPETIKYSEEKIKKSSKRKETKNCLYKEVLEKRLQDFIEIYNKTLDEIVLKRIKEVKKEIKDTYSIIDLTKEINKKDEIIEID
ncbi:hypothetical protein ENUP19_0329G0015 [Entamoeba nuttalli]|uniref:Uncharacterized protein n=2 Tax=Entamoeba nuttalli TaxID=412467 RepID=K2H445_ENTNP|nr:hypothetical protein ENU1_068010 [Entamoeba nuttalli P19]EKE41097.1 hypothetical protein ENU1_068010 [Entamoeba nuttalli P19]|eukprot:XP_008856568.1 hypothetical protein ENU1_068010 [Entamoeba nuttalli P19]